METPPYVPIDGGKQHTPFNKEEDHEMVKKLDRMNLRKKLNYSYTVVIRLMILSGLISIVGLSTLYLELHKYINGAQKADTAVKECRININVAARNMLEMALVGTEDTYSGYVDTLKQHLQTVGQEIETLKSTHIIPDDLYEQYVIVLNEWVPIANEIIELIEQRKIAEALPKISAESTPALDKVVTISQQMNDVTDAQKNRAIFLSQVIAIVGCISIVLFAFTASLLSIKIRKHLTHSILTPLQELESVAGKLAAGNLHVELDCRSDDEFGSMAESLRKAVGILSSYIDDISATMEEFSKGNFDVKPSVEWQGDFQGILISLLQFEQSMSETVKGIQRVADKVSYDAQQVAQNSTNLAEGAAEQSSITGALSATLASVSEQVSQNANNAENISRKVDQLGEEIISSNQKMQEMVTSMNEINQSSEEIGKIIATINDLASQTNLLALNASIEAARAGEAGRGFSVVADQVSVLASQSSEAAKESTLLIGSSVKAVEKGMVIADETASQLKNVVDDSRAITIEVGEVAVALESQTEAISQIDNGVEHINEVVKINSRAAEESATASQEMSGQADNLEGLIRKFRVGNFS